MVYRVVDLLKKANFHNINIDLMFAIPGQTLDDLKQDLRYIKALNIPHISYYSLILEDKTVFNQLVNDEKLILIENDLEAKMYEIVIETLKRNNYQHYEISNFAKNNYQSRHNLVYWNNKHYYGFGMGASGYLNNIRYYNSNHVNHYLQLVNNHQFPVIKKDILNKNEQLKEAFLLGLRLIDGLSINELNKTYNIDVREYFQKELSYLVNNNWIEISERIKLTHQGLFYGNEVFEKFL
jgi:oxygen-independent coproporphyrinogen-3 oxidase